MLFGALFFLFTHPWIDISALEQYDPGRPSIILDADGCEIGRFSYQKREPLALEEMPSHLLEAFISAEDWDFYSHSGLSWKGIVRSFAINLYYGKRLQGASTITQQLVKLLFLDLQKTFSRKLKEQLYAMIIEQQCTKQHILHVYLNHIYFGCGLYGVEAAAQAFWGISARNVSVSQAATLAGIIRSPAHYCPQLHLMAAQGRRDIVLGAMRKRGVISQEEYEKGINESLTLQSQSHYEIARDVKEQIRMFMEKKVGRTALYTQGYQIQTTIDRKAQRIAERELQKQVLHLRNEWKKPIDGAVCLFEVSTGAIKALVGAADHATGYFNRVTQAYRQLGSIFKPIVYAAALEKGCLFEEVEIDEPLHIEQNGTMWSPRNHNKQFNGAMSRAYALSHSNNIVTIKTLLKANVSQVIDLAQRCRLPGPFNPYPSLALGCTDASLLQAARALNIFANGGVLVEPYYMEWVKDSNGKKIWRHIPERERVLSFRIASQVAKVLSHRIKRFKKWFEKQWFDGEVISKTGTTNHSRTCWYIGSTPTVTTAIYIGCDDNQSMGHNVYPVHTAFPIWLAINRQMPWPQKLFSYDPALKSTWIHELSGKKSASEKEHAMEILV